MPVLIEGLTTVAQPCSAASAKARRYAERSFSGSPCSPSRQRGPTAWMTWRAGSRPAPVMTASPGGAAVVALAQLGHQRRPGGAVDGAVDAAAAGEVLVGGVDHRVGGDGGDVGADRAHACRCPRCRC